jgi:pyridoxal biosynthesis lyase PdxS
VPSDIRRGDDVARVSDPAMIRGIQEIVGQGPDRLAEAQALEALEVD